MATLEFLQNTGFVSVPEVLFGDFSENEVATLRKTSSLFNKQPVCFGTFSEDEVRDILTASATNSPFVEFTFDAPEEITVSKEGVPAELPIAAVPVDEPVDVVKQQFQPVTSVITVKEPIITQSPPGLPPPGLMNLSESITSPLINPDEAEEINNVLQSLIAETARSSLGNIPNMSIANGNSYPYSTTSWSAEPKEATHWSPIPSSTAPTPVSNDFSSFYTPLPKSEAPYKHWTDPAIPSKQQNPAPISTSIWSNANGGNQWSALFKNSDKEHQHMPQILSEDTVLSNQLRQMPQILSENTVMSNQLRQSKDHELMVLGSQLQLISIADKSPVNVIPRGLINKSTNCFAHAPLQALLMSPLFHIVQQIETTYPFSPVLNAMKIFFQSFNVAKGVVDKMDSPFEPTCIYEMLHSKIPNFENGRQEDAEEFLGIILSNLHDEMVLAVRTSKRTVQYQPPAVEEEEDGEWQQMGKKNKAQVTRNTSNLESSPVSELFGGLTRSVVSKPGAKESATLQPFLSLQLDIQYHQISHVRDALLHFTHEEKITLNDSECYRRETLESLPPVLILHLKRFIFNETGCQKFHKEINFDFNLTITDAMLSPCSKNVTERNYKLFAIVFHHGAHAAGGHYSAVVYHPYIQCWINCDDDKVTSVDDKSVMKHIPGRSAYLLFYTRCS